MKHELTLKPPQPPTQRYTQTINDWEDREIDAINEPYRPIPSGAITEEQVNCPKPNQSPNPNPNLNLNYNHKA